MDGVSIPRQAFVIGLDVSLASTGIAANFGWCTTIGQAGITKLDLAARIRAVDQLVSRIDIEVGKPMLFVIESVAYVRTAGGVLERDALWWLLVRRLIEQAPIATVAPNLRAMYATGKHNASKAMVLEAVARRFPMFETGGNFDMADAAVLAAMGSHWLGHPMADLPATHTKALTRVVWPDPFTLGEPAGAVSD